MRAIVWLSCLLMASIAGASAQPSKSVKSAPTSEIRYFTYLSGLMGDRADVILKETRQGSRLTAANLDVCFPAATGVSTLDRFALDLVVEGDRLSGTTQSREGKLPVTVSLVRKANGKAFDFTGRITIGNAVSEVASLETADVTEKEFREAQPSEDTIVTSPADFTEVSPEAIGVKVKRDAVLAFTNSLRGEDAEVALYGLIASCAELRSGEQMLHINTDPERAAALIAKFRAQPGVVAVGWTEGSMEMGRTIRFDAAAWLEAGKINRDKVATAVAEVLTQIFPAKLVSSAWSPTSGELTLILKRPSPVMPALNLTETLEITAMVAADKPDSFSNLLLWVGSPSSETADETSGPKLKVADSSGGNDEESLSTNDEAMFDALAKAFKGQRWDSEQSAWK